jgi:hypothetical protein
MVALAALNRAVIDRLLEDERLRAQLGVYDLARLEKGERRAGQRVHVLRMVPAGGVRRQGHRIVILHGGPGRARDPLSLGMG